MIKAQIKPPLGDMIAIADETHLHLLEFTDRKNIDAQLKKFGDVVNGCNKSIESIENELSKYFAGNLKNFKTPLRIDGTDFQQSVLNVLNTIPYAETRSYKQQADILNNPKAVRAIASANGRNQIAIVIPCHRVIGSDGSLTGYAGGLERKQWLLNHERKHA